MAGNVVNFSTLDDSEVLEFARSALTTLLGRFEDDPRAEGLTNEALNKLNAADNAAWNEGSPGDPRATGPIDCPNKRCAGTIEAHTRVYLEVNDAVFDESGVTLKDVSLSSMNDELDGHPLDMESNLAVVCTEGHRFEPAYLADELLARIAPQPIGDAPRTLGKRGGL